MTSQATTRTTSTTRWIGPLDGVSVGDIAFLIEHSPDRGASRHELRLTPAHTNQSHEPRLHGWCGTYNNVATFARGLVTVARVARNGRVFVTELSGAALTSGLEDLGYPDLDPA